MLTGRPQSESGTPTSISAYFILCKRKICKSFDSIDWAGMVIKCTSNVPQHMHQYIEVHTYGVPSTSNPSIDAQTDRRVIGKIIKYNRIKFINTIFSANEIIHDRRFTHANTHTGTLNSTLSDEKSPHEIIPNFSSC